MPPSNRSRALEALKERICFKLDEALCPASNMTVPREREFEVEVDSVELAAELLELPAASIAAEIATYTASSLAPSVDAGLRKQRIGSVKVGHQKYTPFGFVSMLMPRVTTSVRSPSLPSPVRCAGRLIGFISSNVDIDLVVRKQLQVPVDRFHFIEPLEALASDYENLVRVSTTPAAHRGVRHMLVMRVKFCAEASGSRAEAVRRLHFYEDKVEVADGSGEESGRESVDESCDEGAELELVLLTAPAYANGQVHAGKAGALLEVDFAVGGGVGPYTLEVCNEFIGPQGTFEPRGIDDSRRSLWRFTGMMEMPGAHEPVIIARDGNDKLTAVSFRLIVTGAAPNPGGKWFAIGTPVEVRFFDEGLAARNKFFWAKGVIEDVDVTLAEPYLVRFRKLARFEADVLLSWHSFENAEWERARE
jgi:hypothetical protein